MSLPLSFDGVSVLAPMVRVSTLPMRLLSLDYGADLVYSEEIIDRRLLATRRIVNSQLGTVDFVQLDGTVVFRTCDRERQRVVLQMGTADPERAVAAAKMVENDVACIDVNMGCPKDYSTKGGMGAALLRDPERAAAILRALVGGLRLPVTCKIRILDSTEETVSLAKTLAATGVACVAVHGRRRDERPRHPNNNEAIRAVSGALSVPVLANGGSGDAVRLPSDVAYFRHVTGAAGVMLARVAMHNPSIFCKKLDDSLVDARTLVQQYLKYAIRYENPFPQSKYCIQQLLHESTESKEYRLTLGSQTWLEICQIWDLSDWYGQRAPATAKRKLADTDELSASLNVEPLSKRRLTVGDNGEIGAWFRFYRRQYRPDTSPRMILHSLCTRRGWQPPNYSTELIDRLYYSRVVVNGRVYRNLLGDQSKKYAEQSAACVCLVHLGEPDGRKEEEEEAASPAAAAAAAAAAEVRDSGS